MTKQSNAALKSKMSDAELCEAINMFWLARGFEAHARVETRAYVVPAKTVGKTRLPETSFSRREIISDPVNGGKAGSAR
jgi:hypothetical protein